MKELKVKKDFTNIYTQKTPFAYLKEMKRLSYRIPDHTKPLYLSLAKQLFEKQNRPVNIIDIGSSYGINSALLKYDLKMSDLDDFFLTDPHPTNQQTQEFFGEFFENKTMNFYQIDISKPALQFSEDAGLCKKGFDVNLETCNIELLKDLPRFDLVIATGCIGYIGYKAFVTLFELINNRKDDFTNTAPMFAFSALRIFDMKNIKRTFEYYGYSLVKTDLEPICQRQFSNADEKSQTLSLLHGMGIDTKQYEEKGNFYADFYVASPKNISNQLLVMSKKMKKQAA